MYIQDKTLKPPPTFLSEGVEQHLADQMKVFDQRIHFPKYWLTFILCSLPICDVDANNKVRQDLLIRHM